MIAPVAETDLRHVLDRTAGLWEALRGARVFMTGGSGFVGRWLLEALCFADRELSLDVRCCVLTRDASAFADTAPHLVAHPAIGVHQGDVRRFELPAERFSHIVHAAADISAAALERDLEHCYDVIVSGTRRTLELAAQCQPAAYLLMSSGAVYGQQPSDLEHVPEEYPGAPDPLSPRSAYGEGKRVAEWLCACHANRTGMAVKIARCFSVMGPCLPMDSHFATGNFIRDGLAGRPIAVASDGTAIRSYLYAADLAVWLWTILLRGADSRPYNVGSEQAISVRDLAYAVSDQFEPPPAVMIGKPPSLGAPARYVPSTQRAQRELGLTQAIDLHEGLARTVQWAGGRRRPRSLMRPAGNAPAHAA